MSDDSLSVNSLVLREWSEGDKDLEQILIASQFMGLRTIGCCAGGHKNNSDMPYVCWIVDANFSNRIEEIVDALESGCKIFFFKVSKRLAKKLSLITPVVACSIFVPLESKCSVFKKILEILRKDKMTSSNIMKLIKYCVLETKQNDLKARKSSVQGIPLSINNLYVADIVDGSDLIHELEQLGMLIATREK